MALPCQPELRRVEIANGDDLRAAGDKKVAREVGAPIAKAITATRIKSLSSEVRISGQLRRERLVAEAVRHFAQGHKPAT
jgi:hypothetical protein